MTPQEREKVTGYTGFGAQTINSAIANHRIKPKIQADIDILDNAVGKGVIPFAMRVIRKTIPEYLNAFPKGTKITHDMILNLKGRPLTLEIFASTAIEEFPYQGRNVYIELEVPAGYKGALYIAPIAHKKYRYQNELLFHRNLWYKILSVEFENGIYYMKARVLVDG